MADSSSIGAHTAEPQLPVAVLPVTRIRPSHGWVLLKLDELWAYRELLYFLAWRDIKVRYKQTVLGATWAIIQPFMTMVVFSFFFGRLAGIPSDGIPYPIFLLRKSCLLAGNRRDSLFRNRDTRDGLGPTPGGWLSQV